MKVIEYWKIAESNGDRICNKTKLEKARELIGKRFGHLSVMDIIRVPNKSREFFLSV